MKEESTSTTERSKRGLAERTTRRLSRSLAVLGASALAVMMIGSVLALLSDSVTMAGGYTESNDWDGDITPPPGAAFDLRVKQGECLPGEDGLDTAMFSDDTALSFPALPGIDLASMADELGTSGSEYVFLPPICLFNASPYGGTVDMTVLQAASLEVGVCGAAELAAEIARGATDCGTEGELLDGWSLYAHCNGGFYRQELRTSPGQAGSIGTLLPGAFCQLHSYVESPIFENTSSEVDPDILVALSDSLSFDLAIDLRAT